MNAIKHTLKDIYSSTKLTLPISELFFHTKELMSQKDIKIEEYQEYFEYCEQHKTQTKELLNL